MPQLICDVVLYSLHICIVKTGKVHNINCGHGAYSLFIYLFSFQGSNELLLDKNVMVRYFLNIILYFFIEVFFLNTCSVGIMYK